MNTYLQYLYRRNLRRRSVPRFVMCWRILSWDRIHVVGKVYHLLGRYESTYYNAQSRQIKCWLGRYLIYYAQLIQCLLRPPTHPRLGSSPLRVRCQARTIKGGRGKEDLNQALTHMNVGWRKQKIHMGLYFRNRKYQDEYILISPEIVSEENLEIKS